MPVYFLDEEETKEQSQNKVIFLDENKSNEFDITTAMPIIPPKTRPATIDLGTAIPIKSPDEEYQLRQAPPENFLDKIKDMLSKPEAQTIAKAQNIYAISKMTGLPRGEVSKNYDWLRKTSQITGIKPDIDKQEYMAIVFTPLIISGLVTNPIGTIAGVTTFSILDRTVDLEKFVPEDARDEIRSAVDLIDFIGKALVTKAIYKRAPAVVERFTQNKIIQYKLPTTLKLSAEQVKDIFQTGKLTTAEQQKLFAELGLSGKELKTAIAQGITIQVPTEKVVRIVDKPYWAKVKSIFGRKPTQIIRTTRLQKAEKAPVGLLEGKKAPPITPTMPQKQPEGMPKEFVPVMPQKVKPDISGITSLQKQIQAMEDKRQRVEVAKKALEDIDTIREHFKQRITKYRDEYLKEELTDIPKIFIKKQGGIKPDEAMEELRTQFNIEVRDEAELKEYLRNLEQARKDLLDEIKANRPQLVTIRETTLLNQRIRAIKQGIKIGRIQTKQEIKQTQKELIEIIKDTDLPPEERGKFLSSIKSVQTKEQLAKRLPKIIERIQTIKEKLIRKELVEDIKKITDRVQSSKVLAVDYAELIRNVVNQFELQRHRPQTIETLRKTKDFIMKQLRAGEEVDMPKRILDKLEVLQRKPIEKVATEELEELRDSIEELERLGRVKLRLRRMAYERRKAKDLANLKAGSTPIQSREKTKLPIGEVLSPLEKLKNKLTFIYNTWTEKKIALTPMDAVIDELDGNKNYKGINHTVFKQTIDKDYSDYIELKLEFTQKVRKLAEGMNEGNFERIAAYATLQQEGGLEKLKALGYTQEDVEKITLTEQETELLEAMRAEFDKTWSQISEIMRTIYNESLGRVKFYFPFMTDFDAMTDFEIRDRFINVPEYSKILKKNPEMGFTKKRIGGKQKINLNALEVFLRHMDNVSYLLTVGKNIKYLSDLAATPEYREAVGDIGQQIMREWLDLIARKGRLAGDRVAILDSLRKYTGGVYLSYKLSSAAVQFTAIFDGAALIGNYAFEGAEMITHREIREFLRDNFPEWRERVVDDPAFLDFYQNDDFVNKAIQLGISPLKLFDKLTAASVTMGAYKKYCIENGIEFDLAKPNKEAITYAQLIMRRTQSTSSFKDTPLALSKGMLTGNISVDRLILQFQSFLLNRWSLITHDLYKVGIRTNNKQQAVNIAMWLIIATLSEMGIRRMIRQKIKQLKGEKEDEKSVAQDILLNALQNIPFVGNVVSALYYNSLGIPSLDWLKRITEYSSAGFRSKTFESKIRNFSKATLLALPGGSQIVQLLPKKKKRKRHKNW